MNKEILKQMQINDLKSQFNLIAELQNCPVPFPELLPLTPEQIEEERDKAGLNREYLWEIF